MEDPISHLISLLHLSDQQILSLLDRSHYFASSHSFPFQKTLKDKIIGQVFFEPSTRTKSSFEMAAKRLGAEVINFHPEESSTKKGETILDTIKVFEQLGCDALVIRHSHDQLFETLQEKISTPLINAGAGKNEHPTQGLLDLYTLRTHWKRLEGKTLLVVGDIKHSRVAGAMKILAPRFGLKLIFCGPEKLLPTGNAPFECTTQIDPLLSEVDAVMLLRMQLERHDEEIMSGKDYFEQFGLHKKRLEKLSPKALILHPGPFNRGVELDEDVLQDPRNCIWKQVKNGVYTRMAILEYVLGVLQ